MKAEERRTAELETRDLVQSLAFIFGGRIVSRQPANATGVRPPVPHPITMEARKP